MKPRSIQWCGVVAALVALLGIFMQLVPNRRHFEDGPSSDLRSEEPRIVERALPIPENRPSRVSKEAAEDRPAATTPGRIRVQVAEYGRPLGGRPVVVTPEKSRSPFSAIEALTDEHGIVQFDSLAVGSWLVDILAAAPQQVEVRSGETCLLLVDLGDERKLFGVVVDEAGNPVSGASVWFSETTHPRFQRTVAHSASDGTFSFLSSQSDGVVGAIAWDRAVSRPIDIADVPHGASMTIELLEEGAALEGVVLHEDGTPAMDSIVSVGWRYLAPYDKGAPPDVTVYTRADKRGYFSIEGLPVGEVLVAAKARNTALWSKSVSLALAERERLEIVLQQGMVLRGRVLDVQGTVSRAYVIIGGSNPDLHDMVVASDDGEFVLDGVPLEGCLVQAWAGGRGYGEAICLPGCGTLDLHVAPYGIIAGSVYTNRGRALEGWAVTLKSDGHRRVVHADAHGRFSFAGVGIGPHELLAGETEWAPICVRREQIYPGMTDIRISVDPGCSKSASLSGRLRSPEGKSLVGARVSLSRLTTFGFGETIKESTGEDGSFAFSSVGAGRFEVWAKAEAMPMQRIRVVRLRPGESRHLDDSTLSMGGTLRVHVLASHDSQIGRTVALLCGLHLGEAVKVAQPRVSQDFLLSAGTHIVRWAWVLEKGGGDIHYAGQVNIIEGGLSEIEVQL